MIEQSEKHTQTRGQSDPCKNRQSDTFYPSSKENHILTIAYPLKIGRFNKSKEISRMFNPRGFSFRNLQ